MSCSGHPDSSSVLAGSDTSVPKGPPAKNQCILVFPMSSQRVAKTDGLQPAVYATGCFISVCRSSFSPASVQLSVGTGPDAPNNPPEGCRARLALSVSGLCSPEHEHRGWGWAVEGRSWSQGWSWEGDAVHGEEESPSGVEERLGGSLL